MVPSTMNIFFSGSKPSASHVLVDFGDESTTIIPFSRIVDGSTENGRCYVKWPDGKEYDATLVFTGKTFYDTLMVYYRSSSPVPFSTFC